MTSSSLLMAKGRLRRSMVGANWIDAVPSGVETAAKVVRGRCGLETRHNFRGSAARLVQPARLAEPSRWRWVWTAHAGSRAEVVAPGITACSLGLSATSQQYFSLRTNQPPATSQQYFSLRINQHQPSATSRTNRLSVACAGTVRPQN
jgi:hypothetical protein